MKGNWWLNRMWLVIINHSICGDHMKSLDSNSFRIMVPFDYYIWFMYSSCKFSLIKKMWQNSCIQVSYSAICMQHIFWTFVMETCNWYEACTRFSTWHIIPLYNPIVIKVQSIVKWTWQQLSINLDTLCRKYQIQYKSLLWFTNGVYNNTNLYFGFRLSIKNTIYIIYTQQTILANNPIMCLTLTLAHIQSL